jgi:hypothetical protein
MDIKEKSFIETNISINEKGSHTTRRVKYKNKKGTFQRREQCKTCIFRGEAVVGLGNVKDMTCDRDGITWRSWNGSTDKDCKFWKGAVQE